jgi:hypothetical protein
MATHSPRAVYALDDFPDWVFVRCECGQDPIFDVWLRYHWAGSEEDGKAACRELRGVSD